MIEKKILIEERVMVTSDTQRVDDHNGVWVEGIQQSACNACSAKSSCGTHSLSKLGRTVKLWLVTDVPLKKGQEVIIGLPEGALAKSALMMYGLPLLGLIVMAMLGEALGGSDQGLSADVVAMIFGLLGLLLGFIVARLWSQKNQHSWQPQLIQQCQISFTAIE